MKKELNIKKLLQYDPKSSKSKSGKWENISESFVTNIIKKIDTHTYNPNLYGLMDITKEKNR
jgi:hypothetical protein